MSEPRNEPIAIIGSACRFAGNVTSPSKLWELLKEPRDVLSPIPESRFGAQGFHHEDGTYHGHCNVEHSYLLADDPRAFDAQFFGVKPVEARALDPQQRLLLEVAYEGLEAAGLPMERLRGSDTGVYVGLMCGDYEALLLRDFQHIPTYHSVGTARSVMSNRVSYFFDWHGPSMTVDTACSSSLVAVHLAAQALRSGECRVALAAGSNLLLGPENYVAESKLKMLSPDSRSRMWDADANGYARGDGVAVVVLKTLRDALADGDHIDCVIRETGTNQDGATKGITMPSAAAQQALIRATYAKAGLDLRREADRPQYFEAHGTGTPAGDPIEAEAIQKAFFQGASAPTFAPKNPLYVGSIKTVLGHTEGTAGLAAVLKASLALQNGAVPPNLLFNRLNPDVAPFYSNLQVPTKATTWPALAAGQQQRRVSVNSFGFGGANAHAILESFAGQNSTSSSSASGSPFVPYVFSAASEKSLAATLGSYSEFLATQKAADINAHDLAQTLLQRRSELPFRASFPAGSLQSLKEAIDAKLAQKDDVVGIKSSLGSEPARILGVFTGQGAQYARMGAELIERSPFARKTIQKLESYLSELPTQDRPLWSLEKELLANAKSSRLQEAAISQPLCTAIQILLVRLLRLAHVQLDAVVGHSSGEIAAAYAAGYLSERDAMYIAYYRGVHCKHAASPNGAGIPGAMLAVGTSLEDAEELCSAPEFAGRVGVAASNSSSSVTLSGDDDAIAELEDILEDEKKFKRRLRVDMAYHSLHMKPCSAPYIQSLRERGITVQSPAASESATTWFSSVRDQVITDTDISKLADIYWSDNMVQPVLFSQALERALSSKKFDLVLEIGAHPALKGPASQTIQEIISQSLPYSGVLVRGGDAVSAVSNALGFLWTQRERSAADLGSYEAEVSGVSSFAVVPNLPSYAWNHENKYWHESRQSKNFRTRSAKVHPLLGDNTPDSSPHHLSWRNLLRTKELPWIPGHQLQNQTVFPAAGYLASALEASRSLAGSGEEIQLIEVEDFVINQALVFDEEDAGVETLISLAEIDRSDDAENVRAKFTFAAAVGKDPQSFSLVASGRVRVALGAPSPGLLPQRGPEAPHMIDVEENRFYASLADLGYIYTDHFRALSSLKRKLGRASGLVDVVPAEPNQATPYFIHPATLDCALQAIILAYSYPHDGRLWSLHVPTSFARLRVNPALCGAHWDKAGAVAFDAATVSKSDQPGIFGDADVYGTSTGSGLQHAAIQLEGMRAVPFAQATAADDRKVFSQTVWAGLHPDGELAAADDAVSAEEEEIAYVLERIATFYTRKFDQELPPDHPARREKPFCDYLNFCQHINTLQKTGKHVFAKKEWLNDTYEDIVAASAPFAKRPDVRIMHVVGEHMPRVFRGETTILEHLRPDNLLDDYYVQALGFPQFSKWLAHTVGQITHRYPHMNILEVGAGTGGATKSILKKIGTDFDSYTFTDISSGFFETAQNVLAPYKHKMVFKPYNAEQDPAAQGFTPGTYDLVVASFVIHATSKLEEALRNVRRLLKPGGYAVLAESTNNDQTRAGFVFGTLPGWWAGVHEGRVLSPCVSSEQWDEAFRNTGFSGIDTITPEHFEHIHAGAVIVAHAVDDRVAFLREPLSADAPAPVTTGSNQSGVIQDLAILGGSTLRGSRLIASIKNVLKRFQPSVKVYKTLEDIDHSALTPDAAVLSLLELDKPVFKDITPAQFASFKNLFLSERTLLWVTSGRRDTDPFSNMVVGFGRTAVHEVPELRLQFLDFEDKLSIDATVIVETLLRFQYGKQLQRHGGGLSDLLWTVEPEIVVDRDSRLLIPRQEATAVANDRYNTDKRPIARPADLATTAATVTKDEAQGGYVVRMALPLPASEATEAAAEHLIELHATVAVLSALKTRLGHQFLFLGVDRKTNEKRLALTNSLNSEQVVSKEATVPVDTAISSFTDAQFLTLAAANLLAATILDGAFPGQTVLVHDAPLFLAHAVLHRATAKGVTVIFTADAQASNDVPDSWIKLSSNLPKRDVQNLLPQNVASFWGFAEGSAALLTQASIISTLPAHAVVETAERSIFAGCTLAIPAGSQGILGNLLEAAVENLTQAGHVLVATEAWEPEVIAIKDLTEGLKPSKPLAVVASDSTSLVPVEVARLDSQPLFRSDRTYWLVGLSGTLGLSLCDWMIEHGARYVVITSRNPTKIDTAWVDFHAQKGATVALFANDVTNEEDLKNVHKTISETLPPITGVIQGAMVLEDAPIRDMTYEQMTKVLRPRVNGTIYLDQIFANAVLDFFVLLSSMTGVIGNPGQSNYTTANTFMATLAAERRKRGVAASVVNIGVIVGAGYVTREVSQLNEQRLDRGGMQWMSEPDFHQLVAEAIEAGKPDAPYSAEVSTGLREILADAPFLPNWHDNPKFSRFVLRESAAAEGAGKGGAEKAGQSIRERLEAAESKSALRAVIKETFGSKLRAVLQLDTEDDALMEMHTDQIGLDSLIAVDIRSWFLKNFEVNIPVLKILGGTPIAALVEQALQDVPSEFVPNLKAEEEQDAAALPVVVVQKPADRENRSVPVVSGPGSSISSDAPDVFTPLPDLTRPSSSPSVSDQAGTESDPEIKPEPEPAPKILPGRSSGLSFSQSMFWFVHSLMEDKTTLNHTGVFRVTGNLRVDALSNAVKAVGYHHEALRTCFFVEEDGQHAMQGVLDAATLYLEEAEVQDDADVEREYEAMKSHVFDLAAGQIMRMRLLTSSPGNHQTASYLLLGCHHINVDGISQQVLMRDLDKAYRGEPLDPNVLQYMDYAAKQRADADRGAFEEDVAYWKKEFATIPEPLPLTRSRTSVRQPKQNYNLHVSQVRVDASLAGAIRDAARGARGTAFHFYLTAFEVLLHRVTGARDFAIGIADGNRKDEATLSSFGPFVNLLPLRFQVGRPQTFAQELADARTKVYAALAHSQVPFEVLLSELHVTRSLAHSPIFQAFADYRQGTQERQPFADAALELLRFDAGRTAYDLSIDIIDNPGGDALVWLMGQADLYAQEDLEAVAHLYHDILAEFSASPQKRITSQWQFREEDTKAGLALGRGKVFPSSWPETLVHQIQAVADANQQKVAVVAGPGDYVTYKQLVQRADAIACALLENDVEPGQRVAVFQDTRPDWACSMLAILKIGAVYVPLDPKTRVQRLTAAVRDCGAVAVLVDESTLDRCEQDLLCHASHDARKTITAAVIDVSQLGPNPLSGETVDIAAQHDGDAVILYTSGSTGTPKGVVLTHENFRHEVEVSADVFGLGATSVVLQQSSFNFDMSVLQMFLGIALGGTLAMVPADARGDALAVTNFIARRKVSFTCATPSEYSSWLQFGHADRLRLSPWACALSGGEPATEPLLAKFRSFGKPALRLFNGYGPTETTCCSTKGELVYQEAGFYSADVEARGSIPAGIASPNESIYILDEQLRPLPAGLPGEIVIGGIGVAREYLNNETQTQASFVVDNFATEEYARHGWKTMYRTKDRGRLLRDGRLLVEGRIGGDTEIKLRGMRLDLREVEQTLLRVAGGVLSDAAVSVRGAGSSEFLVGHVVFAPSRVPADPASHFQRLLADLPLPDYMVPVALMAIEGMPTTTSGKLDREAIRALPVAQQQASGTSTPNIVSRPLSDVEKQVKSVWVEVLSRGPFQPETVEADSDFFHIGGTSMLLVEVQAHLRKQLGSTSLALIDLFKNSTLAGMARVIEQQKHEDERGRMGTMDAAGPGAIDWELETRPPVDLWDVTDVPVLQELQQSQTRDTASDTSGAALKSLAAAHPKTVLLTGAGGFLGRHILQRLIDTPDVTKVICVAVRNLQARLDAGELPPASSRVVYYESDLRFPRLGLGVEEAGAIFSEVDAAIHNAADVSHLKRYATLKAANVGATAELARLCLPRGVPIHYVSTAGTAMFAPRETFGEVSAADIPPPPDGHDGYTSSKWASERLLERISDATGLPVWIHRPSSIVRPEAEQSPFDLLQNLLSYSRKMRAVPASAALRGTVDLVAVETVSRGIVEDVLENRPRPVPGETTSRLVSFVHQTGDWDIPLDGMKEYLEREESKREDRKGKAAGNYEALSIQEWAARAEQAGLHTTVATVFAHAESLGTLVFPRFVKTSSGR